MNGWTLWWIGWGAAFAVGEGIALANRRRSDTLSEQAWIFLGLQRSRDKVIVQGPDGTPIQVPRRPVTGWAYVRRTAVGLFMLSLTVHFLIGSDAWGNGVLIGTSSILAVLVVGTGAVRWWRNRAPSPRDKETHGTHP